MIYPRACLGELSRKRKKEDCKLFNITMIEVGLPVISFVR